MKNFSRHKFSILCVIIFALVGSPISASAQKKILPKTSKSYISNKNSKIKSRKPSFKIFSAGVINTKAIDLIKPEYPKAAQAVNVYGSISVSVLIDESGNVVEAKVESGHPFLRAPSVKAALESKFEPFTLSGQPMKVRGIIIYNFIPQQWNWFEVGYALRSDSYYSIERLSETLPFDWKVEKQFLDQLSAVTDTNRAEMIKTVIALIHQKLIDQTKAAWLFECGLALSEIKRIVKDRKNMPVTDTDSYRNLKSLVENPPMDVNRRLIEGMQKIILLIEENKLEMNFSDWQKLEEIFPYVGN